MRKLFAATVLVLSACSLSPTNLASGQTAHITCIDSKDQCEAKAARACPRGYAVVREDPPVGTGIYTTDHTTAITAQEEMAYSMTVQCK